MIVLKYATLSPLFALTLFFMAGIVWASFVFGVWSLMPLFACAAIGYNLITRNITETKLFLALAFFVLGSMRYQQQYHYYEMIFKACDQTPILVEGVITDIEISDKQPDMQIITIALSRLANKYKLIPLEWPLSIKIKTTKNNNPLKVDDYVSISSIFLHIGENENYKRYLIKENLIGYAATKKPIVTSKRPISSWRRFIQRERERVLCSLKKHLSPYTYTLFCSIFWGKKEIDATLAVPIKEQFKTWGIVHYLARSGLHVVLFIMFWHWILSLVPLPFVYKEWLFLVLIISYHFFSWASISFVRSILLFGFYKFCNVLNLQINMLHLLALTAFCILFINPFQIFFLDFQLSFGLTFALFWLAFIQNP